MKIERAFHTLSIRKSDNVKKLNHISCLVGMLNHDRTLRVLVVAMTNPDL